MNFFEKLGENIRNASAARGCVCDCCGAEVFFYPQERFCKTCENKMHRNDQKTCGKCGRAAVADGVCLTCKSNMPKFDEGFSPFVYQGGVAALINRMKSGKRRLTYYFAERMAQTFIKGYLIPKTEKERGRYATNENSLLIIPVPLSKNRRIERGYNQAEDLAKIVCAVLEKNGYRAEVDCEVLQKLRDNVAQKEQGFRERIQNVKAVYHVKKRAKCQGKTVLLIDDVMTTGATGSICAERLKRAGAREVLFLVGAALPERKNSNE